MVIKVKDQYTVKVSFVSSDDLIPVVYRDGCWICDTRNPPEDPEGWLKFGSDNTYPKIMEVEGAI